MAKMTKAERSECEKNLALCRAAVAQFEKMLSDDDAAKSASSDSMAAAVKAIADGGTGDARQALKRGVLAIREAGGHSIADAVHGKDRG